MFYTTIMLYVLRILLKSIQLKENALINIEIN